MHYGKDFQNHRRLFQEYLSRKKVDSYTEIQVAQARQLAVSLAKGKEDREHLLERSGSNTTVPSCIRMTYRNVVIIFVSFGTSIAVRIAYGHDMFLETDDTYNELIRAHDHNMTHCGPIGATPVDLFPIRTPFRLLTIVVLNLLVSSAFPFVVPWSFLCRQSPRVSHFSAKTS